MTEAHDRERASRGRESGISHSHLETNASEPAPGPVEIALYAHVFRGLLAGVLTILVAGVLLEWFGYSEPLGSLVRARSRFDTLYAGVGFGALLGLGYGLSCSVRRSLVAALIVISTLATACLGGLYLASVLRRDSSGALLWTVKLALRSKTWLHLLPALLPCCAVLVALRLSEPAGLRAQIRAATLAGGAGAVVVYPEVPFASLVCLLLLGGLFPLGLQAGAYAVNRLAQRLDGSTPWPDAPAELRALLARLPEDSRGFDFVRWRAGLRGTRELDGLIRVLLCVLAVCGPFLLLSPAAGLELDRPKFFALASSLGTFTLLVAPLALRLGGADARQPPSRLLFAGAGLMALALVIPLPVSNHEGYRLAALLVGASVLVGLVPWRLALATVGLCLACGRAWRPLWAQLGAVIDPIARVSWLAFPDARYPLQSGVILMLLALPWRSRAAQLSEMLTMLAFGILAAFAGVRLAGLPASWYWSYELIFRGLSISMLFGAAGAALGAGVHGKTFRTLLAAVLLGALTYLVTTSELEVRQRPYSATNMALLAAAEAGDREAAFRLGQNLRYGIDEPMWPKRHPVGGWTWIRRAAEAEHPEAMYRYGIALAIGSPQGIVRDRAAGQAWVVRAANAGSQRARTWLEDPER